MFRILCNSYVAAGLSIFAQGTALFLLNKNKQIKLEQIDHLHSPPNNKKNQQSDSSNKSHENSQDHIPKKITLLI